MVDKKVLCLIGCMLKILYINRVRIDIVRTQLSANESSVLIFLEGMNVILQIHNFQLNTGYFNI